MVSVYQCKLKSWKVKKTLENIKDICFQQNCLQTFYIICQVWGLNKAFTLMQAHRKERERRKEGSRREEKKEEETMYPENGRKALYWKIMDNQYRLELESGAQEVSFPTYHHTKKQRQNYHLICMPHETRVLLFLWRNLKNNSE